MKIFDNQEDIQSSVAARVSSYAADVVRRPWVGVAVAIAVCVVVYLIAK